MKKERRLKKHQKGANSGNQGIQEEYNFNYTRFQVLLNYKDEVIISWSQILVQKFYGSRIQKRNAEKKEFGSAPREGKYKKSFEKQDAIRPYIRGGVIYDEQ